MNIPEGIKMEDIPSTIMYLWACSINKMATSGTIIEQAMKDHPEYFVEELEYRRKMATVPQEVHDAYHEDCMHKEMWRSSELPNTTKGLYYYSQHPEEYQDYWEASKQLDKQYDMEEIDRQLWNKYYEVYGLGKPAPTAEQIQAKKDKEEQQRLREQHNKDMLDGLKDWLESL